MSKEEQKGLHPFYNNALAMREKQKCMEYILEFFDVSL